MTKLADSAELHPAPTKRRRLFMQMLTSAALVGLLLSLAYLVVNVLVAAKVAIPFENAPPLFATVYGALQRASVDLSAVTPLVLVMFFLSIFWNGLQLLRGQFKQTVLRDQVETLPFTPNYETLWVQLGLIGTLWGFMLIGIEMSILGKAGSAADSSKIMKVLLDSFGTALLSSFSGVVLAYIFAPPVIRFWQRAVNISPSETELDNRVEALTARLKDATTEVAELSIGVDELNDAVRLLESALNKETIDKFQQSLNAISKEIVELRTTQANTQESFEIKLFNAITLHTAESQKQWSAATTDLKDVLSGIKTSVDLLRSDYRNNSEKTAASRQDLIDAIKQGTATLALTVKDELKAVRTKDNTAIDGILVGVKDLRAAIGDLSTSQQVKELIDSTKQLHVAIRLSLERRHGPRIGGRPAETSDAPVDGTAQPTQKHIRPEAIVTKTNWVSRIFGRGGD